MTLVLEATVSHLARPVKEDGSGQRTTLDPARFSKRYRPSVLSGRAAELAQHQRSRPRPVTNGCRQPKNLVPVASALLGMDRTTHQSSHIREIRRFTRHVPPFIGEITDTGRKPEA